MTRIPQILNRNLLPEADRHAYDTIEKSRGEVRGPYTLMLNSPSYAMHIAEGGAYVQASTLTPVQLEIAILTAAREADCRYVWAAHVRNGRQVGVREEAFDLIGRRAPLDTLNEVERPIVRFGRELLGDHNLSEEAFAAIHDTMGDRGVSDLTATLGHYTLL